MQCFSNKPSIESLPFSRGLCWGGGGAEGFSVNCADPGLLLVLDNAVGRGPFQGTLVINRF